jgi:hypothetical protein
LERTTVQDFSGSCPTRSLVHEAGGPCEGCVVTAVAATQERLQRLIYDHLLVSLREKNLDDSVPPELERCHGAENRKMSVNLSRYMKLFAKEIFEILV